MRAAVVVLGLAATAVVAAPTEQRFAELRQQMVREIEADAAHTAFETGKSRFDPAVMAAMASVLRHRFVPAGAVGDAYDNRPLGIGHGQTISQPYVVALMTDLLNPDKDDVVLEVGTGSGYQAAVLSGLVKAVYSMDIIEPLAKTATQRLKDLGYDNVTVRTGDGYYGWPEHGPYDGIVVTAAASSVPPPLIQQLKPGGRMVIPVGGPFLTQQLMLVEKSAEGRVTSRHVLPVRFVPLTGKH